MEQLFFCSPFPIFSRKIHGSKLDQMGKSPLCPERERESGGDED